MKPFKFKFLIAFVTAILITAISGCINTRSDWSLDLSPIFLKDVQRAPAGSDSDVQIPKIALVLGGGGVCGFAHIGILRALEDAGIRPDIVVGTSAGTVVGAAYASGMTPVQIESVARSIELSSLVDFTVSRNGIMRGKKLAEWVDTVTSGISIERFPIRFAAVATDLKSERAVLLDRGSPGNAIQASAAVPGVNVPVPYRDGHLIDGGITSLVPVNFAMAMGATL
jgi:NTE family protein